MATPPRPSDGRARSLRALVSTWLLLPLAACAVDGIDAPVPATIRVPTLASVGGPTALTEGSTRDASGTPTPVDFATYDGSREVVHPDVVTFPSGWQGHRYWAALTPYPNSASRFENPSLFGSETGDGWAVPAGVSNPLATTKRGYLSDPDMVYEPTRGQLWLYYREVVNGKARGMRERHLADQVWLTTSSNGVTWSAPRPVATERHRYVVSPTVVRRETGAWTMWQVDAGPEGCNARETQLVARRSTDGVHWNATAPVRFAQAGFTPWHVDVQWVPARQEYWALVAAYVPGQGCNSTSLFLATSPDGAAWTTYPTPVLARGAVPQFDRSVYRSTFAYEADGAVTLWFTGARTARPAARKRPEVLVWSAATTHTTADALLARVRQPAGAALTLASRRLAHVQPVRTEDVP